MAATESVVSDIDIIVRVQSDMTGLEGFGRDESRQQAPWIISSLLLVCWLQG